MNLILQRYRIRSGALEGAENRVRDGLVPLLRDIPGFHSYYLASEGQGEAVTSIALFRTAAGAAAADRCCTDWFRADWPTFRMVGPDVTLGEVLVYDVSARAPGDAPDTEWPERRSGADRRRRRDRRTPGDRRAAAQRIPLSSAG